MSIKQTIIYADAFRQGTTSGGPGKPMFSTNNPRFNYRAERRASDEASWIRESAQMLSDLTPIK